MATKAQISLEHYLSMSFDGPDCEYLDGEIVERNVGENPHSLAQLRLSIFFGNLSKTLPFHPRPEIRLRISPTRYRVVDLAVFAGDAPTENVPSTPPAIAIEIVSRDDRYMEIVQKLEEYRQWGVRHVWLVDPWLRKLYTYGESGLGEVPAFHLPEFDVRIPAAEILEGC